MVNSLSPFVIVTEINQEVLMFNTLNNSIIKLTKKEYDDGYLSGLNEENRKWLYDNQYFESKDISLKRMKELRENDTRLLDITISFTQNCNFKCTYCSQLDNRDNDMISNDVLLQLVQYIKKCVDIVGFKRVGINLFGGEPLLYKDKIYYFKDELEKAIDKDIISYGIGTNGSLLDTEFLSHFDQLGICIPITNKEDHDINRPFVSGKGSFDTIIDNLRKCNVLFDDKIRLGIRCNIGNNTSEFGSFLCYLKNSGLNIQYLDIAYTNEFPFTNFKNSMTLAEYKDWYVESGIDLIVRNGFKVRMPRASYYTCKAYSKYSIKMYSDGMLGTCNGYHYGMRKGHISEALNNIDNIPIIFSDVKNACIVDDQCCNCKYLFLCGGKYFCRTDCCDFSQYSIEKFLNKYYELCNKGFAKSFE